MTVAIPIYDTILKHIGMSKSSLQQLRIVPTRVRSYYRTFTLNCSPDEFAARVIAIYWEKVWLTKQLYYLKITLAAVLFGLMVSRQPIFDLLEIFLITDLYRSAAITEKLTLR